LGKRENEWRVLERHASTSTLPAACLYLRRLERGKPTASARSSRRQHEHAPEQRALAESRRVLPKAIRPQSKGHFRREVSPQALATTTENRSRRTTPKTDGSYPDECHSSLLAKQHRRFSQVVPSHASVDRPSSAAAAAPRASELQRTSSAAAGCCGVWFGGP